MTWTDWIGTVQQGDCLDLMKQMPEGVVHCVVTSPPYFGLRDYQTEGQMGLEKTPEEYVSKMVEVFREVKRIMHPTGTLFLNMGDSYAGQAKPGGGDPTIGIRNLGGQEYRQKSVPPGLKPKDLLEMPSRLVLALQADGWWLRCRIPWLKRNAMPESCQDRPTQAVEYVFLLSKSKDYFYDGEAVRVKARVGDHPRSCNKEYAGGLTSRGSMKRAHDSSQLNIASGRSRRNSDWFFESWQGLWTDENGEPLAFIVNPKPYKGGHFATFPPGLVIPCIRAGTSEKGCCPECGSPWVRIKKPTPETMVAQKAARNKQDWYPRAWDNSAKRRTLKSGDKAASGYISTYQTLGWRPTCDCGKEPVPCLVLDCFAGTGTVIEVARKMGRAGLGFEISEEYVKKYCAERLAQGVLGLNEVKGLS